MMKVSDAAGELELREALMSSWLKAKLVLEETSDCRCCTALLLTHMEAPPLC